MFTLGTTLTLKRNVSSHLTVGNNHLGHLVGTLIIFKST